MDYHGRLKRLQTRLHPSGLDALLVTHLPNIRYLSGFSGSSGVLIVTADGSIFITDGRYTSQARAEVRGAKIVIASAPLLASAEWLLENHKGFAGRGKKPVILGIEAEHLTVASRSGVAKVLKKSIRLKEAPHLIEQARMVKDDEELRLLRAAAELGSKLFEVVLNTIRPGITENEVAAEMEYAARRAGAEEMAFPTIIASGKRSALPHGRASDATIPARGFVVCDFGVILAGYCSDMTRTVYVGNPNTEARRGYQAVQDAQQEAVEAVRPGVAVAGVDRAARKVLKINDLAKYFTHSTGHGLGLEIHEAPRIAKGQADILRTEMVVTVEPGFYIPGKWGIRIEDTVAVRDAGAEILTRVTKKLITL